MRYIVFQQIDNRAVKLVPVIFGAEVDPKVLADAFIARGTGGGVLPGYVVPLSCGEYDPLTGRCEDLVLNSLNKKSRGDKDAELIATLGPSWAGLLRYKQS